MRAHAIATQLVGSGNPLQIIRLALLAFHRLDALEYKVLSRHAIFVSHVGVGGCVCGGGGKFV